MRGALFRVLCISSLALFFELLLVRYLGIEIKFFTFFKNFVLMASILGLGLGTGLARQSRSWMRFFHPVAAIVVVVALFAPELGVNTAFLPTGDNAFLWYHPTSVGDWTTLVAVFAMCIGLTALIAIAFMPLGQALGRLLDALPPSRSYAWDLGGSIAGVVAYSLTAFLEVSPKTGLMIVLFATLAFVDDLRSRIVGVCLGVAVAALLLMVRTAPEGGGPYWWSPYHRVHWEPYPEQTLADGRRVVPAYFGFLNGHYYFDMVDFRLADTEPNDVVLDRRAILRNEKSSVRNASLHYSVPYLFKPAPADVLILGAGPGNDAAVALRNGAKHVTVVEIDPAVARLGREIHPLQPYRNERVEVVVDDGRAFMARCDRQFDVVSFGHLDSINLTSAFSSVRTDSYIYTVESMRTAYSLVRPGGVLTIGFTGLDWSIAKLQKLLVTATGMAPYALASRYMGTTTFIVRKPVPQRTEAHAGDDAIFRNAVAKLNGRYVTFEGVVPDDTVPTDDWPFLFLRDRVVSPYHSVALAILLLLAFVGTRAVFPRQNAAPFAWTPFWLGAGFMLIETKSITELGLLFGSTWMVTAISIVGVLVVNLAAVAASRRWQLKLAPLYVALFATIAVNLVLPLELLLSLPIPLRLLAASVLIYTPLLFGGAAFVRAFTSATTPSHVFGANLLGAMVGGTLEYLSVVVGFRALWMLGALVYLLALAAELRTSKRSSAGLLALSQSATCR